MEEKNLEMASPAQGTDASPQLGILEKTYGTDFGMYVGCAVLLFAFFAIPLYLAGAFRSSQGWIYFGIILVCLGGGVAVAFFRRKWQISLYKEGLIVIEGKQVQVARWQDIIAVDRLVRTISSNAGGYPTRSKQTNYQLRLRNGRAIMITTDFSNRSELIETIEARVQQARTSGSAPENP